MRTVIENQFLRLEVDSRGGELASIRSKQNGLEYLWQGDPAVWGRRSPVLFPNAGQVCENFILLDGKKYPGKKHGLIRDIEFCLLKHSADTLVYQLTEQPETQKYYPFAFRLELSYQLKKETIEVGYHVYNSNSVPLPFGIGGHPAFRCPIQPTAEAFSDYEIVLESPCTATERLTGAGGLLTGAARPAFPGQTRIPLCKGLFDQDSFLLDGLTSPTVALRSRKTSHAVVMHRGNLPYFLLWSVPGEIPFLCLEPWQALPDKLQSDHDFLHKEGNLTLAPAEGYHGHYSLDILS